jgi:hypothetical protein
MTNLLNFVTGDGAIFGISYNKSLDRVEFTGNTHAFQLQADKDISMISYNGNAIVVAPVGNAIVTSNTKVSLDAPYVEVTKCLKLIPTSPSNAVNNSLFIDSSTGELKFKDINGVIKKVNLT